MWKNLTTSLGKYGFHLVIVFGLLYIEPFSKVFGDSITGILRQVVLGLLFGCVVFAGDEVIRNAESQGGKLVKIALWVLNIMDSIKGALKSGNKDKNEADK